MPESLPLPRVPRDAIRRPRLEDRLAEAYPLTVLRAAGGAGKSILLAQWLTHRAAEDARFVYIELGRRPTSRAELLALIAERVARFHLSDDPDGWLAAVNATEDPAERVALLSRALDTLSQPLTIVIDDYSSVTDPDSDFDLVRLLEQFRRLRCVVATRSPRQLSGLRIEAAVDVSYIDASDLFLTPDEAVHLIESMTGQPVPDSVNLMLARLPLTARIMGTALKRARTAGAVVVPSDNEVTDLVFDHFLHDPEASASIEFQMRISVVPRVTVTLGAILGETDRARELLEQAVFNSVGTWAGDPDDPVFSFYPNMRAVLQRQAARRLTLDLPRIHHDLARWALAEGNYTLALENALAVQDYLFASRVVREGWVHVDMAQLAEFMHLLNEVPSTELAGYPVLLVAMGLALNAQGHRARAVFLLEKALVTLDRREVDDDPAEAVWWLAVSSIAHRLVGNYPQAAHRAHRAVQMAPSIDRETRYGMGSGLPLLIQMSAVSLFYNGEYIPAVAAVELAQAYAEPRFPDVMFGNTSLLVGILAIRGDMPRARALLAQLAAADPPEELTHSYFATMYRIGRAIDRLDAGEPAAARAELDAVRAHYATVEHWAYFCTVEALIDLVLGAPAHALATIDAAQVPGAHPPASPSALSALWGMRAMALLSEGQVASAKRQLRDIPAESALVVAFHGLSQLVGDKPEKAMATLAQAVDRTVSSPDLRSASLSQLIYASAALRLGHTDTARDIAEAALETMRVLDGNLSLQLLPRRDLVALRDVVTGTSRDFVVAFLASDPPPADIFPIAHRSVPLTTREMVLLRELPSGDPIPVIAARLSVSANTVKAQLRSLYRKLGVSSREEAVSVAAESGHFFQVAPPASHS